ncbi:helix-turn-helix domain-containing protein [Aureibacter tunicatorum]|uniref:Transcriptional regulator with XRE-family HTH domain n=1 Tax=Aureibacter tunicatorum TaxID=866807 RepID=A0AAE3XUA3_9BACT|nr:helix-turn-helix transcriptional regulator [Aureibacter tunicatorum]MDR6242011.1 transcriptional regulator with XRE-family HTH domain [Aureibacter tunicatorum]BDD07144.1 hypothetical protein AUTU_46270 [Aureibacter tunicatorum]BDD07150.1 hypothetical protein AUTU_46330 [Aureibacter tunicatorum]
MLQIYTLVNFKQTLYDFFKHYKRSIFEKSAINRSFCSIKYLKMVSFGKKLRECRELKSFSQSGLAREINVHHSIIGRYERDEAKPTIDILKKLAFALGTTAGYLLGETEDSELFKDPKMLERLKELSHLPQQDKECILYTLDGLLQNVKARQAFGK